MRLLFLAVSVAVLGCGGATAEAPLTLKLGVPRAQADADLKAHQYCHTQDGPVQKVVTYPRCERAGTEWGESWVKVTFENEKLAEVKRYERFTDDARAIERWNQLVTDRMKVSPDAPDAGDELRARGPLEPGTRSVKAFRLDADTIVAVYLLAPSPPEQASVLEAIIRAK